MALPVTIDPTVPAPAGQPSVRWDSANQQWVDTARGNLPWNHATQSWAPAPATPAITPTEAGAGTGPPLGAQYTQAQIDLIKNQAGAAYQQGNADVSNAAANTSNASTNATNAQNAATANQQRHEEALVQAGLDQQTITNKYNSDAATFGVAKATLLLQGREAQAKALLDSANFQETQNRDNAQQRQTMAAQQLDALKMLAARQGPQDYTKWDYITGMGGNAPKPQDSRTYSPLDMIAAQYQPSNVAAPGGLTGGDITVPDFPGAATQAAITPAGSGTPAGTATTSGGYAITSNRNTQYDANGNYIGLGPNTVGATPPPGAGGTTPTGPIPTEGTIAPNAPGTRMAGGGTTPGAAVVGDQASGKPTGHEEVAYASNNPQSGVAELHVIPHHMIAGLIDQATGRKGGLVMHASKVPKAMHPMLPHAYAGGDFAGDIGNSSDGASAGAAVGKQVNTGEPDTGSGVPQYQASAGTTMSPPAGTSQYTPSQPLTAPSTAPQVYHPVAGGVGTAAIQPASSPVTAPTTATTSGAPADLVGGFNMGGTAAPPPQSLGPAGYDPYRITQNQYSPTDMNNSPLVQMLKGTMPVYGFQGQGNYQPGIQSQGITNLPIGLNYADYLRLDPTRQAMEKSMYDNPETGESFDQLLSMAKAAAPRGNNFGVAKAR